ncbi:MAG: deiodinase-like protein [Acidimicrobiia bacterium]
MEERWLGTAYSHPDDMSDEVLAANEMTREFYEGFVRERAERNLSAPREGDPAPDFAIERLGTDGSREGVFRLADARDRAVALAFGSYTATPFRRQLARLDQVCAEYRDRVDVFAVYIHEAHPNDGWQIEVNRTEGVLYDEPTTMDERAAVAHDLVSREGLAMPVLLDDMANEMDRLYAAMPVRLYLIDEQGTVIFRTVAGSPGFDVDAWRDAIRRHVDAGAATVGQ